eukprot:3938348-Rhodomonas_salina.2
MGGAPLGPSPTKSRRTATDGTRSLRPHRCERTRFRGTGRSRRSRPPPALRLFARSSVPGTTHRVRRQYQSLLKTEAKIAKRRDSGAECTGTAYSASVVSGASGPSTSLVEQYTGGVVLR